MVYCMVVLVICSALSGLFGCLSYFAHLAGDTHHMRELSFRCAMGAGISFVAVTLAFIRLLYGVQG
jgi:hypothetical protein